MTAPFPDIDRDLILRIAAGEQSAFKVFFEIFWPQVYGTSLRLTRSPEQAKDLSQEIFLRVWENRQKLPEVSDPKAYIFIVSKNYILDQLRKKVFDPSNLDYLLSYFSNEVMNPQQSMEFRELEEKLNAAIAHLPEKVRQVFQLSRTEGLTHEQIATRLNISVVSSKTYIVRALQGIRQYMAEHPEQLIALIIFHNFYGK